MKKLWIIFLRRVFKSYCFDLDETQNLIWDQDDIAEHVWKSKLVISKFRDRDNTAEQVWWPR